jgi:hypothetical protein
VSFRPIILHGPLGNAMYLVEEWGVMMGRADQRSERRWSRIYPLLIGVYSVLHLAASNPWEWLNLSELVVPLATMLVVTALAWLGAAALARDPDKRALLAAIGVVAFAGYGTVFGMMVGTPWAAILSAGWTTLLAIFITGAYAALFVVMSRRSCAPVSRFMGTMATLLVVLALAQLAMARRRPPVPAAVTEALPVRTRNGARPPIYLLILDKYTGSASLKSYYGYDNSQMEQALRARGFVLPRHPRANYSYTRQAVISLLNWSYLDSLADATGHHATSLAPLFRLWERNRAMAFLKGLGYEIVVLPNGYPPFRRSPQADRHVPPPDSLPAYFPISWRGTTLWAPLAGIGCAIVRCRRVLTVLESASLLDWKFDQLGALAATTHPRFVLAHLPVPHEPFVYRADCQHAPAFDVWAPPRGRRQAYLDQITCVNRKVLATVDAILQASPTPPVILIQADHGDANFPVEQLPLTEADPVQVRARLDVFAAYHVPGAPDTLFYDGMSPVNLLPRVFNQLFGTAFPRLPDRSYWVRERDPYNLSPVLDDLGAAPPTEGRSVLSAP